MEKPLIRIRWERNFLFHFCATKTTLKKLRSWKRHRMSNNVWTIKQEKALGKTEDCRAGTSVWVGDSGNIRDVGRKCTLCECRQPDWQGDQFSTSASASLPKSEAGSQSTHDSSSGVITGHRERWDEWAIWLQSLCY